MRKQVPPEKTKDVLDFATKKPKDRLTSIVNGLAVSKVCFSDFLILTDTSNRSLHMGNLNMFASLA